MAIPKAQHQEMLDWPPGCLVLEPDGDAFQIMLDRVVDVYRGRGYEGTQ